MEINSQANSLVKNQKTNKKSIEKEPIEKAKVPTSKPVAKSKEVKTTPKR